MSWVLEATLSNAVIATAGALVVVAMARFLRHRPGIVHAMWFIVLLKLVTPPLIGVPVTLRWEARPASPESAVELPGDVVIGAGTGARQSGTTEEALSEADVAAPATELERMRAAPALQDTTTWEFRLPVLILSLVGTVVWTVFAALRIARFHRLLRTARPCGNDVAAIASRTARRLGLRKTPAIVIVDARIPPLVWHAGRAPRIVLPSEFVSKRNNEQLELLLAHELAHVKRADHLVRWFTLAVLAVYWWHPVAWWAVRRLRVAEEQCCDAMVVAASPTRARTYAETLLDTFDFLAARRSPMPALASGAGSGGSLKRRCEMILSGRTKVRTGRITGMLLLLVAIAVLPTTAVVHSDDKSDKSSFDERPQRLAQSSNVQEPPPELDGIAESARNTEGEQEATKSVVAYWRFQGGTTGSVAGGSPLIPGSVAISTENLASRSPSSSLIEDSSGNGRHGRAVGGPKYRSVDLPGSNLALAFDGHDDRVAVPDAPIFHLTKSFTLEAYIEIDRSPKSAAEMRQIVFRGDNRPSFDPWFLAITKGRRLRFLVADALGNASILHSPEPLPTGKLVHVAATLDDRTGKQSLFINGKRVATIKTEIRACGALEGRGAGIGIGNRQSRSKQAFAGTIDEVRISAEALLPSQFLPPPRCDNAKTRPHA